MNATVNVLCYKSKTLSNGEHPLMIRVCKDGKKKYVSLGVSVKPQYWDFDKNRPKRNCPNKEQINTLIKEQEQKYSEQILDFSSRNKDYTLTTLVEIVDSPVKAKTVNYLFVQYIEQLKKENRIGYALSVRQVYFSLLKFNGHLDIYFQEIDVVLAYRLYVFGEIFDIGNQSYQNVFFAIDFDEESSNYKITQKKLDIEQSEYEQIAKSGAQKYLITDNYN